MNSVLFVGLAAGHSAPTTARKLGLSVIERGSNIDPGSLSRCKLLVFAAHNEKDLEHLRAVQQRCKPVRTLVLAPETMFETLKWDLSPQFEVVPVSAPQPLVNAAVIRAAHALRVFHELKFHRRQATIAPELIGHHPLFRNLLKERDRLARTLQPLLLVGEPGTGKQALARTIHRIAAADGPFIQVACGQFPELLADYLFRGIAGQPSCITLASGGTLLITELESASPEVQEELAELLARQFSPTERPTARLICTVHGADAVEALVPTLRKELTELQVPALKDRGMDVQLLAEHFLQRAYDPLKRSQVYLCENARNALQKYHWPGNIAELRLLMARARLTATNDVVTLADCGLPGHSTAATNSKTVELATPVSAGETSHTATHNTVVVQIGQPLDVIEKEVIVRTMEKTRGNRTKAAEILGISVRTLYTKLQEIGNAAESKGQLVATKAGKSASDWRANG